MKRTLIASPRTASQRQLVLLACAIAVVWTTGISRAAIHYYVGYLDVPPGSEQPLDINLEGDDLDDIVLQNDVLNGANYQSLYVPYTPGAVVGFTGGEDYVSALGFGSAINASTVGTVWQGSLANGSQQPSAQFNDVHDAYIGFSFPIGGSTLHYGWLRVDVDNAAGTLYLKDWAYEDQPGVGIAAGDIGSVPIPGDLNANKRVDGTDFLQWQRGRGTSYNYFHFFDWERNYGGGLPTVGVAASVPEPASAILLAASAAAWPAFRRMRKRLGQTAICVARAVA